jgi:coenzyme F420-0:L-glutamate ligase/coenzyme F420-1:gamma-L-glutamate ligase
VDSRNANGVEGHVRGEVTLRGLAAEAPVEPSRVGGRTAGAFYAELLEQHGVAPQQGDILVVSSKVTTMFEGGVFRPDGIVPSRKARWLGRCFGKDPRKVQIILETGPVLVVLPLRRILQMESLWRMTAARSPNPEAMKRALQEKNRYVFMTSAHGAYLDDAGIDYSNIPDGSMAVLPPDPCATARRIRDELMQRFGVDLAVIVTDTTSGLGRVGSNDIAIGFSGIDPVTRQTFSDDLFGVPRSGGVDLVVDSIAGMAGLVMGQTTEMIPAVLVRGVRYNPEREEPSERGIAALTYPPGVFWRGAVLTVLATLGFRLVSLLSFQRNPKRTRS